MTSVIQDLGHSARPEQIVAHRAELRLEAADLPPLATPTGARDEALDAVKGWLVLFMVLYHWLNYFVGFEWGGYRYLRFLTPSFIFIAGFLVSHVYLQRYAIDSPVLRRRLVHRGGKLLLVFLALNAAETMVGIREISLVRFGELWQASRMAAVLVDGEGGAAFAILLDIAYFFFLAPLTLAMVTRWGVSLWSIAAGAFAIVIALGAMGVVNTHAELLAIACLGLAFGSGRLGDPERLLKIPGTLVSAYAVYLAAITTWDVPYWLEVVGVCLSVALLYLAGRRCRHHARVVRQLVALGRYSLLAYVAQIAVLQILSRAYPPRELTLAGLASTLFAATLLTLAAVHAAEVLRNRWVTADRAYRMVFA
jgi:peptidoglycan/LPS O-acetylase OafA/YrhL